MKKLSVRKLSLLGLVLIAASAVTAAVLPKDNSDKTNFAAGSATASTGAGAGLTCKLTAGSIDQTCFESAASGTTAGLNSSDANGNTTLPDNS